MSIYQTSLSEIEKDILIKTEVCETDEFRIKTELENLHLVGETDPQISAIDDITTAFNFMYKLLDEIKGIATHKERLGKTQRVIGLSTSLLQLVTQYERDFNINPDSTTQDGTQIGSLIWYRGVLGVIEELRKILIVEAQNAAVDNETAALRFENLLKIKKKWQRKAQRRYPGAR